MNDLISRQTAIDAAEHITTSLSICANTDEYHGMKRMQRLAIIELTNLPSAQPEQKVGKFVRWIEKIETHDCISYTPHCKCSLCGNELFIENINYCYMCGARLVEDRGSERWEE